MFRLRLQHWVLLILIGLLAALQYRLWASDGNLAQIHQLQREITRQRAENEQLQSRNQRLRAEVKELKSGLETVEEQARHELGMIREGETLYRVLDE